MAKRVRPTAGSCIKLVSASAVIAVLYAGGSSAYAQLPAGPAVPVGAGTPTFQIDSGAPIPTTPGAPIGAIDGSGTNLSVGLNDSRTVINWTGGFNIGAGNSVKFEDTRVAGSGINIAVLNRDTSGGGSSLMGALTSSASSSTSNIAVYVINPSGILFGPGGSVNVGSLVASTLDLNAFQEQAFLSRSESLTFSGAGVITITPDSRLDTTRGALGLGQLILLGSQITAGAGSSQLAGTDAALVAGSEIQVGISDGLLSIAIDRGTIAPAAITASGFIDGRNVTLAFATRGAVIDALLSVGGQLRATSAQVTDRGIVLAAGSETSGVALSGDSYGPARIQVGATAGPGLLSTADIELRARGSIEVDGPIYARDVAIAGGAAITTGEIRARDDIVIETVGSILTGALTSGTRVGAFGRPIEIAGAADTLLPTQDFAGHDVLLSGGTIGLGAVRAYGTGSDARLYSRSVLQGRGLAGEADLDVLANGNVELRGITQGRDIAISAGGKLSADNLSARDDLVIRAAGTIVSGMLSSGATVDGHGATDAVGAADAMLAGVGLAGSDLDVGGDGISTNVVRASGTNSDARLYSGGNGVRGPGAYGEFDLDVRASGNIELRGDATGLDIAIDAGGTVTSDNLAARDDLAIRAGGAIVTGTLNSGAAVGPSGSIATDVNGAADGLLLGVDLAGRDIDVAGTFISSGAVSSSFGLSDVRLDATGGLISGAGALGEADLNISAADNVILAGLAVGRDVRISSAFGTINTGEIRARDDIYIATYSGAITTGAISSGTTVGALGPIDVAGVADLFSGLVGVGNNINISASDISTGMLRAYGTSSESDIRLGDRGFRGSDIKGLGAPGEGDVDIRASGLVETYGTITGRDVAILGSTIYLRAVRARDDIAIAGRSYLGIPPAVGVQVGGLGATDVSGSADELVGTDLMGNQFVTRP
jgi:filamentous hemagglutinin family protein